jgi:hypothetical protein
MSGGSVDEVGPVCDGVNNLATTREQPHYRVGKQDVIVREHYSWKTHISLRPLS